MGLREMPFKVDCGSYRWKLTSKVLDELREKKFPGLLSPTALS